MIRVALHRGREARPLAGHPWIYASEVAKIEGDGAAGAVADVVDWRGSFVGRATVNPRSQILARILTWDDEAIDREFFRRRLEASVARRRPWVQGTTGWRVVFGEADLLPGLIVDRYDDLLVVQTLTAGMEAWLPTLAELLTERLAPRAIFERNDAPPRRLEGLGLRKGFLAGGGPTQVWIEEAGAAFLVDVAEGQKTGFFSDQRENRAAVRALASGREMLDCFCYSGGFTIQALAGGAASAVGVDLSAPALRWAAVNADRNGVAPRAQFREGNAFDLLRGFQREGRRFDLVVLDPPAFTKSKAVVAGALRGYKEINLRAMKLLREGGLLVSSSCSYHLDREAFLAMLAGAAQDARRRFHLVDFRTQARDHPILVGVRETQYLKCAILQAL